MIYVRHTGKELSFIEQNMERDKFLSPKEALDFGLIDKILEHPPRQGDKENTESKEPAETEADESKQG